MRCYDKLIALWVVLCLPLAAFSADLQVLSNTSKSSALTYSPVRDGADEDSILIIYDFEDGWAGWTASPGLLWHPSEFNAFEDGSSWWCGIDEREGYTDHLLQYLVTPEIDLSDVDDAVLTFKLFYAVEDTSAGGPGANYPEYNGWDGCNVWITTNGEDWEVLTPTTPDYTFSSLFSFGWEWGMDGDIPGWAGYSDGWLDAEFDLSDYADENVQIRWAFCSDPAWNTVDNEDAIGFMIDDISVSTGGEPLFLNDGSEQGDMELDEGPWYWELTDEDGYESEQSMNCPINYMMRAYLVSPPIEVPPSEFYTYFDFRVRCDTRMYDSNGDNTLNDFFSVWLSEDGYTWDRMIYDYAADQEDHQHHPEWLTEFGLYEPGTAYDHTEADWKWKLNLTPFAEQTIYLRWMFESDEVMDDPQGTGLYIDDVRLQISSRVANDIGVEFLNIPHPISIGFPTRCVIRIRNYGIADQGRVPKYYQIDDNEPIHIGQPHGLASDSTDDFAFYLVNIPYADTISIRAYTEIDDDQNEENDELTVENVVVYPPGIMSLGYDSWNYQFRFNHDMGEGPAVLFTPRGDGYRRDFDIEAIRVRWNGEQQGDANIRLHIYEYDNNQIQDELYTDLITVTRADVIPNIMVIDLSDIDDLQALGEDFLVWFELVRDDFMPQIIFDRPDVPLSAGHYFTFDSDSLMADDRNQWMIHAIIMAENTEGTELSPGRWEVNFDYVQPEEEATMRLAMFNGGTNPVTIEAFEVDNNAFDVDPAFDLPLTLRIGDMAHLYITFSPTEVEIYRGELTFTSNDENPPVVRLYGSGDLAVDDDALRLPTDFALGEAYPNPFNATTAIPYLLPYATDVKLALFDLSGRLVTEVVSGRQDAGSHVAEFDASGLGSGVYIYRLEAADFSAEKKIVLVK